MRPILVLIPALLASCGTTISQREVLGRAKAEVALREPWAASALVVVEEKPAFFWSMWKIRAGQLDYSGYPIYKGLDLVPGTERRLRFARDGCLRQYDRRVTGCNSRYQIAPPAVPKPDK